ncbi:hypothetical protein F441_13584 [Phytophthora nicotianae CJ01A1]|uniref:Uncharacterized protein n=3 Tax=Phytophthora nicotianae TaxID=4792 RepID=V9EPD9_PHYNI|nr:hypothetical protein F443_13651 [Phytophthora nicotianae P1569]ETP00045.1 hypothetical protein F441_22535 [Phytophthora nicotianae CJ01A1]ETP10865.1 hypothetical protein F441_13584 [Phytophthora nicotianae CJ01A1]ETP39001.1 hypothetical protein F442_13511 [Phytophthora nicotianae P10297]
MDDQSAIVMFKVATIKTGENVQFDFDVAHPPA